MAWTGFQLSIAVLMVVTGSINTLAAKWADQFTAQGVLFDHPFLQAVCMFIGESLCLPAFFIVYAYQTYKFNRRNTYDSIGELGSLEDSISFPRFNLLIFWPAAVLDMIATSTMYVGLNLTFASSFQMLRGSVIIFTGLLSMCVLKVVLKAFRWFGMVLVMAGLTIVGLADIMFSGTGGQSLDNIMIGDGLIIVAQLLVACQMVYEQKYVMKYDVPALLAVGLEGFFGMITLAVLIIPMHWIVVPSEFSKNPGSVLEDVPFAFKQMAEQPLICVALAGTIFSIAFFNFAGISVTKELSATTRMVLDSVRTLIIWVVSLALVWQSFVWLTVVGFIVLLSGMFVYNDLIFGPWLRNRLLPWLQSNYGANCGLCFRFWGADPQDTDQDDLVQNDDDDSNTVNA